MNEKKERSLWERVLDFPIFLRVFFYLFFQEDS